MKLTIILFTFRTVRFHNKKKIILEEEVVEESGDVCTSRLTDKGTNDAVYTQKRKSENINPIPKKKTLSGLVKLHKTCNDESSVSGKEPKNEIEPSKKSENLVVVEGSSNGLSLLGAYSGSDSD